MTKRQAINKGDQLQGAFQVLFDNEALKGNDSIVVECAHVSSQSWVFNIKTKGAFIPDVMKLAQEVEKLIPNVRVTQIEVLFSSRAINLVAKELGKRGIYVIEFQIVRA